MIKIIVRVEGESARSLPIHEWDANGADTLPHQGDYLWMWGRWRVCRREFVLDKTNSDSTHTVVLYVKSA